MFALLSLSIPICLCNNELKFLILYIQPRVVEPPDWMTYNILVEFFLYYRILHCCVIAPSGFSALVQLVENWTNTPFWDTENVDMSFEAHID